MVEDNSIKPGAERWAADERARNRRAVVKDILVIKAGREESERIDKVRVSGSGKKAERQASVEVSKLVLPQDVRPVIDEASHIGSEWDGSKHLIDSTPLSEEEFDLAWTEAPLAEGEGHVVEFGAHDMDPDVEIHFDSVEAALVSRSDSDLVKGIASGDDSDLEDLLFTGEYSVDALSLDAITTPRAVNNGQTQKAFGSYAGTRLDHSE